MWGGTIKGGQNRIWRVDATVEEIVKPKRKWKMDHCRNGFPNEPWTSSFDYTNGSIFNYETCSRWRRRLRHRARACPMILRSQSHWVWIHWLVSGVCAIFSTVVLHLCTRRGVVPHIRLWLTEWSERLISIFFKAGKGSGSRPISCMEGFIESDGLTESKKLHPFWGKCRWGIEDIRQATLQDIHTRVMSSRGKRCSSFKGLLSSDFQMM